MYSVYTAGVVALSYFYFKRLYISNIFHVVQDVSDSKIHCNLKFLQNPFRLPFIQLTQGSLKTV
ncbi:hypothetical protein MIS46_11035 [Wielerella bovis]|uniref:hypothetical protein n=1 Tax=Wielerella bovis TaxID=2917790 RepID=UPI00201934C1|nr:hypothetical protein [Wielerella bovis]ULJ62463.1 hypothetical protein MIS46_11035 [Wielerella bovis]